MNKATLFVTFAAGAVLGFAVSYKFAKDKFEQIAHEEIESVKKAFKKARADLEKEKEPSDEENEEPVESDEDFDKYVKEVKQYETTTTRSKPHVISPEEFGEDENYEIVNLTYYSDGIVADDDGNKLYDIENTIGRKALESFGNYEDDAVHVVNDELQIYYEILLDPEKYSTLYPANRYYKGD